MKILSLKLKEDILAQTDQIVKATHVSRNGYINEAVKMYNMLNERRLLKKKLVRESQAVYKNSLEILAEMEKLQDGLSDED